MDSSIDLSGTPLFEGEQLSETQKTLQLSANSTPCYPSNGSTIPPDSVSNNLRGDSSTPEPQNHNTNESLRSHENISANSYPSSETPIPSIDKNKQFVNEMETDVEENMTREPPEKTKLNLDNHYNPDRLRSFKAPFGFVEAKVPERRAGRSIAYDAGVVAEGVGEFQGRQKWYCLIANCRGVITIGMNKSNITDHLRALHKVESVRTKKLVRARVSFGTKLSKERLVFAKMNPCRYHQINATKFCIHQMLPFNFVESTHFRTTIRMLDQRNEFVSPLYSKTVKKLILEMYLATTNDIKQRLKSVSSSTSIPFLHLNVDLWTSRVSADKYFGVRIFFIDEAWRLKSFLLAVRRFRPYSSLVNPSSQTKLSDILQLWTEKILSEFGVSTQNLLSKVTDSGSDVKRLCSKLLPGEWDWCLSHLCNCAVNEAFGTGLRKDSCKNIEVRTLIEQVRKVVEHLHKSLKMRAKFEDLQLEMEGKALKLLQDQAHRWLGTVRLLERVLLLWDYICIHYHRVELRPFPVEPQRKLLLEIFSVMKPVAEVIVSAQSANTLTAIDTFLAVCNLYPSILEETSPLPLRDPGLDGYKSGKIVRYEHSSNLEIITRKTRRLFRAALLKRFYEGYNGTTRSRCYEMQVFLHPSYRKLSCLDRFMESDKADTVRLEVKTTLHELALRIAKSTASPTDSALESVPTQPSAKRQKRDDVVTCEGIWNFSSFEECEESQTRVEKSIEEEVMDEINRYLAKEKVKAIDLPSRKLLAWWKTKAAHYPTLSVVARSILGHPASAAAIERDFGITGMVLHPSRNRTDAAFVDMQLFLRSHLQDIPAIIPELSASCDSWTSHIPNRFTGIEPIETLVATSEADMSPNTNINNLVDSNISYGSRFDD